MLATLDYQQRDGAAFQNSVLAEDTGVTGQSRPSVKLPVHGMLSVTDMVREAGTTIIGGFETGQGLAAIDYIGWAYVAAIDELIPPPAADEVMAEGGPKGCCPIV
jgi:hypothetical protein